MRPATEAVVKPFLVIDGEAGRFLIVEWAACFPFAPGTL